MSKDYRVTVEVDKVVVMPLGDFTIYRMRDLEKDLSLFVQQGLIDYTFDLRYVTHIDSFGIGCMLSCVKDKLAVTKKVLVINCQNLAKLIIEKCDLSAWIEIGGILEK